MKSENKAFMITAAFEGAGYSYLVGSFDGAGFSWGVIQFQLKSGTLQSVLRDMYKKDPERFVRCCTVKVDMAPYNGKTVDLSKAILDMCKMAYSDAVKWAEERQTYVEGKRPKPFQHWMDTFKNLGSDPVFQEVQRQHAAPYMNKAKAYMDHFGFKSERALALLYDICVQMGSIKSESMERYNSSIGKTTPEKDRLLCLAKAVAPQAGKWASDVLERKATIAKGTGSVHGRPYDLGRDFGLGDGPLS